MIAESRQRPPAPFPREGEIPRAEELRRSRRTAESGIALQSDDVVPAIGRIRGGEVDQKAEQPGEKVRPAPVEIRTKTEPCAH